MQCWPISTYRQTTEGETYTGIKVNALVRPAI